MNQVVINVPDMQSTHCQTRVNNVVKEIEGVHVQSVEAGKVTVSVASDSARDQVANSIEKAGYKVSLVNAHNS